MALQDAAQPSRLSKLAHEGHGRFCRLLSWIESLGEEMEVPDPDAARELALEKEAALGTDNTDEGEIKLRAAEGRR